ncbi:hypothetical protein [Catenuloplanes atrovinosus]|uniref:Uncharacterized protein n=1 Tax=Catenuloplanes atrovinosus TaxID=137266 RepID=A0AAE4C835_9ACTN|nr:hypothetical protein [Catenuloplanes atrovinosus]MDR7274227.1 hypothetical protein [Catenuloplanes atrovinosus]
MPEELQDPTPDVTPPVLEFDGTWGDGPDPDDPQWLSGPEITIRTPEETSGDAEAPTATVDVNPFEVNTGDIVDRVVGALEVVGDTVTKYNDLRTYIGQRESWIFAVSSEADVGGDGNPYNGGIHEESTTSTPGGGQWNWETHTVDDYYGASPQQVTQLNTYQHQLLTASADLITLVGQYIMAVDAAAQAYANIDYASQFPDPPQITEIF